MQLVDTKDLKIYCSSEPDPYARVVMPDDSPEEIEDKEDFPFKLGNPIWMEIIYKEKLYELFFRKGWKWNGANIPEIFWIIFGSNARPKYLLPSMVHDRLCNDKYIIYNNRYLSSLIFKELLLACKSPKSTAFLMFHSVDNYQKFQNW